MLGNARLSVVPHHRDSYTHVTAATIFLHGQTLHSTPKGGKAWESTSSISVHEISNNFTSREQNANLYCYVQCTCSQVRFRM